MSQIENIFLKKMIQEPYRLFFPLGVVFGLFGVGHWLFYGLGLLPSYLGFQHASIQIQLFMYCFVSGFLLTAMPKVLLAKSCSPLEFFYFAFLLIGIVLSEIFLFWMGVQIFFVLGIIGLHVFLYRRNDTRQAPLPPEFTLLFFAFFSAVSGALTLLFYQWGWFPSWAMNLGRQLFQQGFLLGIVMSIGGFMGPRFMGYYSAGVVGLELDPVKKELIRKKRVAFHLAVGLILFFSFWLEPLGHVRLAYLIRAIVVSAQILYTTKIYRPLVLRNVFGVLMWLSFWLLLIGLWGLFLFPAYHMAFKHFIFIGCLSLLTFSVATKVIYSHAGLEALFHKRMFFLLILGIAVLTALFFRVLADFMPESYFKLIVLSSTIWLAGVLVWASVVLSKVFTFGEKKACPGRAKKEGC